MGEFGHVYAEEDRPLYEKQRSLTGGRGLFA